MLRSAFAALVLVALTCAPAALAQDTSPPPPPPPEPAELTPPPPDPCAGEHVSDPGCPEHPPGPAADGAQPVQVPVPRVRVSGSSSSGSLQLGGGDGEAFLALAVIAAMAAPIIIYAVDDPAEQPELDYWARASARVEVGGGVVGGPAPGQWLPVFSARAVGGYGGLGLSASLEASQVFSQYGAADAHLLIRPPPRIHIEGAIALGLRRVEYDTRVRAGFELSLPHRYVIFRTGRQSLGIDLRPGIFIGPQGADFRLESGLAVPLGEIAGLTLGARAYSFDNDVRFGFSGALSAAF